MKVAWLWSAVYKGVEVSHGQRKLLWLGWTNRDYKRRGW